MWARLPRKMLDAEARPTQVGLKRVLSYEEVDVFAAIKSNYTPQGIGELLRPRQHVVDPFAEALCEGGKACPLYVPFLRPELGKAPWAPRDPVHRRAAEAEKARRPRNDAKVGLLNAGQVALPYLRYIVDGEIPGAWDNFGGFGARVTNLAH